MPVKRRDFRAGFYGQLVACVWSSYCTAIPSLPAFSAEHFPSVCSREKPPGRWLNVGFKP